MRIIAAALLAGGLTTSVVQAAPRAESALECGIAADMALVADSLAKEQVERPQADAIMVRIYDVSDSDRGMELMRNIMDAAYTAHRLEGNASGGGSTMPGAPAPRFAEKLFATCMQSGGNMDDVLGRRS